VFNLQRLAVLSTALGQSPPDPELIYEAMKDRVHQPYRKELARMFFDNALYSSLTQFRVDSWVIRSAIIIDAILSSWFIGDMLVWSRTHDSRTGDWQL
jgi:hypothetical protein